MSGIFHDGPPKRIVRFWQAGDLILIVSQEILAEYYGIWARLAPRYRTFEVNQLRHLLAKNIQVVEAHALGSPVCKDPSDDMFLECAMAGGCQLIVSGDRQLQAVSGYADIDVISPREFVDRYR